jgi:hypothetical protein
MQVDLCTTKGRTYALKVEENDKINKKHAFFRKIRLLYIKYLEFCIQPNFMI